MFKHFRVNQYKVVVQNDTDLKNVKFHLPFDFHSVVFNQDIIIEITTKFINMEQKNHHEVCLVLVENKKGY